MNIPETNQEIFKEALKNGTIIFVICMIVVEPVTWFVAPVPQSRIENTIVAGLGNGVSGLLFGFVGLTVFFKQLNKKEKQNGKVA